MSFKEQAMSNERKFLVVLTTTAVLFVLFMFTMFVVTECKIDFVYRSWYY